MLVLLKSLFSLATSRLGAICAWLVIAALGLQLVGAKIHAGHLTREVVALHKAIDDPKTGWAARLGQCHANVATLEAGIADSNKRIDQWKSAAAAASARANDALRRDSAATKKAAAEAVVTLGLRPGADHCASALELIRRP